MVVERCRDTRLEDMCVYCPLEDKWTDAADELADANGHAPLKMDLDMESMWVVGQWDEMWSWLGY